MFTILLCYFSINTILAFIAYIKIGKNAKLTTIRKVDRLFDIFLFGIFYLLLAVLVSNKDK